MQQRQLPALYSSAALQPPPPLPPSPFHVLDSHDLLHSEGNTALHLASQNGHLHVVEYLVKVADVNAKNK